MKKLYILLNENKLPNKYACAFALASMDSVGDIRNDVCVTFTSSIIYNVFFFSVKFHIILKIEIRFVVALIVIFLYINYPCSLHTDKLVWYSCPSRQV